MKRKTFKWPKLSNKDFNVFLKCHGEKTLNPKLNQVARFNYG